MSKNINTNNLAASQQVPRSSTDTTTTDKTKKVPVYTRVRNLRRTLNLRPPDIIEFNSSDACFKYVNNIGNWCFKTCNTTLSTTYNKGAVLHPILDVETFKYYELTFICHHYSFDEGNLCPVLLTARMNPDRTKFCLTTAGIDHNHTTKDCGCSTPVARAPRLTVNTSRSATTSSKNVNSSDDDDDDDDNNDETTTAATSSSSKTATTPAYYSSDDDETTTTAAAKSSRTTRPSYNDDDDDDINITINIIINNETPTRLNKTTRSGVGDTLIPTVSSSATAATKSSKTNTRPSHDDDDDDDDIIIINDETPTRLNKTTRPGVGDTLIPTVSSSTAAAAHWQEKINPLNDESARLKKTIQTQTKTLEKYKIICKEQEDKLIKYECQVQSLTNEINDKTKIINEQKQSIKKFEERIQELQGSIRVFLRVRPQLDEEKKEKPCSIKYVDETTMEIGRADKLNAGKSTKEAFTFNKIFLPKSTQSDVFEELLIPVESVLEGCNVCVFAYGQTGSGKTYTMEGKSNPSDEGMIQKTVHHIFQKIKELEPLGWSFKLEAYILEIYNEKIMDLLDPVQKDLQIRMTDLEGTDLYVKNLKTVEITCPDDLHMWLRTAQQNRAVAATEANNNSSRSHLVSRIKLTGKHEVKEEMRVGNLNLIDLAGSERWKNEEAARTNETKHINKSLSNLGNVIRALKKQEHVPYRNSKLTHLLMPSLGGNSKILMLVNISPLDKCFNETINSLRFASEANSCKTGSVKKTKTTIHSTS